jgi:hypothetical protein
MTTSLIVLVPVLVLGVVVLLGFAGCGAFTAAPGDTVVEEPPPRPPIVIFPIWVEGYEIIIHKVKNLRAFWQLNDAGTTAKDSIVDHRPLPPRSHDGEYKSGATGGNIPGVFELGNSLDEGAAKLDGANGYVAVPFDPDLNPPTAFTVEAWIRPDVQEGGRQVVAGSYQLDPPRGFDLTVSQDGDGNLTALARVGDGSNFTTVPLPVGGGADVDKGWRYVAMTYDKAKGNGSLSVYARSGAEASSRTDVNVGYQAAEVGEFRIGAGRDPGDDDPAADFFPGLIDEVALYYEALDPATILKHFEAVKK